MLVRWYLVPLLLLVLASSACTSAAQPDPANRDATITPAATATPSARPTEGPADRPMLPRGGRELFPKYRLVGYAGLTGAKTLGRLGTGRLDQRVRELERRARPYANGRQILPVLEVIATVVQGSPGRDGKYRVRIGDKEIATYLKAARKPQGPAAAQHPAGTFGVPARGQVVRALAARTRRRGRPRSGVGHGSGSATRRGVRPYHRRRAEPDGRVPGWPGQALRPAGEGVGLPPGSGQRGPPGVRPEGARRRRDHQVRRRARASRTQDQHLPGGQPDDAEARACRVQAVLHRGPARSHWPADDSARGAGAASRNPST